MSNAARDLDQALPIALAQFRAYIAAGVIPADGTVQGWGDLAAYTDHNLIAIEAIFPDDKDDTACTRADFDPRIDELAIVIEAAIASGDLNVGLTAQARAAIIECIADQHRTCRGGARPCWSPLAT
ncbi:hypothetical protein D1871_16025 [Nakamurella silvestris]|nr:hypothetical protein D1871_16025 [Nakamurella silvestris]